jgi:hypothetical protein
MCAPALCWRSAEGARDRPSICARLFAPTGRPARSSGDGVVLLWRYGWQQRGGQHPRGIDLLTVAAERINEKHSYAKG